MLGSTTRRTHRRLSHVARDPRLATFDDIEALVRAHGVPETGVWAVCDRMESTHLDPVLVWSWVVEYDGGELVDLLATGISDRELLTLLGAAGAHATRIAA